MLLKREDLNHTGSHKINNVLGQALLTSGWARPGCIAETGAGQHGVATATAAALFGLECIVYMGEEDTRRQALNVARMRLLGAEVVPVTAGSRTLKDAINEAMRDWVTNVEHTHYLFGTVAGPHPFPRWSATSTASSATRRAQQVARAHRPAARRGRRLRRRRIQRHGHLRAPSSTTPTSRCTASRPAATASRRGGTRRRFTGGAPGVLHGARTYVLQDEMGQTIESHSHHRRPRLPGRRPRARLAARHRPRDLPSRSTDAEAMDAFAPALPHRGHHPGHRERARARRRPATSAASSGRTR